MTVQKVEIRNSYDVICAKNELSNVGKLIKEKCSAKKVLIVTDTNVQKYYLEPVIKSLDENDFDVFNFIVEAGEKSKILKTIKI